ncbi:hypothetical protein HYR54_03660 [Candidatus Acetothermia bacterium]|nr:hypothetical protein [Candidatus Acetothermia bacterium]
MDRIKQLRTSQKVILGFVLFVLVAGAAALFFGFNKTAAQQATNQPSTATKPVECHVIVKGYTITSSGPVDACNFTLDLSQSALRDDLQEIKQMLSTLAGQKSIDELKSILEKLDGKVADKSDVSTIVGHLDQLIARGYETKFGFGAKFGTPIFSTSLTKQVGDLNVQAMGYASLPSDAALPKLCGEVGAGRELVLGLGTCLQNTNIQRYVTLGYRLKPFNGFAPTMGVEFSEKGISVSVVVNGTGIR